MITNLGMLDRLLRVVLGNALLIFAYSDGPVWAYAGIIPLISGTVGWCPLYRLFAITSKCPTCTTPRGECK
jgi:hypothetical protein